MPSLSSVSLLQIKTGKEILNQLMTIRRNLLLYPLHHAMVTESAGILLNMLGGVWKEEKQINFTIFKNEFYFQQKLLVIKSKAIEDFKVSLLKRGVHTFTIDKGVAIEELISFAKLSSLDCSAFSKTSFSDQLKRLGVQNITASRISGFFSGEVPSEIKLDLKEALKNLHFTAIETIKSAMKACKSNQPLNIHELRNTVNSLMEMSRVNQPALLILTAIKSYDEYTYYHSVNTCILALAMGMKLKLSDEPLNILGCSALLHDIGKILIPQEILNKVGPLTNEEKELLRKHALDGAQILASLPDPYRYSSIVAFEHHTRYDIQKELTYTDKKRTHIFSRIVQIADVYDAGASRRSYKKPWLPVQSVRYLLIKSGTIFDPTLTKVFADIIGLYPIGSLVELNTKELALVTDLNPDDTDRPKLKIIKDKTNREIEPFEVELAKDHTRNIVNFLNPQDYGIEIMKYI